MARWLNSLATLVLLLLLVVILAGGGCADNDNGNNAGELDTIPMPSAPYTSSELKSMTSIPYKLRFLSNTTVNDVFDVLEDKVITFSGNKYIEFEPELALVGGSQTVLELVFYGKGYIDDNNCDSYSIYIMYMGVVETIQCSVAWSGVPDEYKQLAIDIVEREEPEIINKTSSNPDIRWVPEKYGYLDLLFTSPSAIPESPHAWITIDLQTQEIISLEKEWWQ